MQTTQPSLNVVLVKAGLSLFNGEWHIRIAAIERRPSNHTITTTRNIQPRLDTSLANLRSHAIWVGS